MESIDYTATAWGETHHYEISEDEIRYEFGPSRLVFKLRTEDIKSVREKWQTHRYFRAGIAAAVVYPMLTMFPEYLRKGHIGHPGSLWTCFLLALPLAGLFLIFKFRKIHRMLLVKTKAGDELGIYRDDANPAGFENLKSRLMEVAAKNARAFKLPD